MSSHGGGGGIKLETLVPKFFGLLMFWFIIGGVYPGNHGLGDLVSSGNPSRPEPPPIREVEVGAGQESARFPQPSYEVTYSIPSPPQGMTEQDIVIVSYLHGFRNEWPFSQRQVVSDYTAFFNKYKEKCVVLVKRK